MIRNYWYPILASRTVGRRPMALRRLGKDLVLWRPDAMSIVVAESACPHRGADLSQGRVRNGCLECPYHGFRFAQSGNCVRVPCSGSTHAIPPQLAARTFPAREAHGLVWMWWGEAGVEAGPLPWFDDIAGSERTAGSVVSADWPVHLTRLMENMLDLHHFPFVHRIFNPGLGQMIDPYHAEVDDELIHVRGALRNEAGRGHRKPVPFEEWVRFPGLLLLKFGPFELVAFATPIDADMTWFGGRYYQHYLVSPNTAAVALGRAISFAATLADWHVAQRQDLRVLARVRPRVGEPHVNTLVGADRAISLWYRLWQAHQDADYCLTALPDPSSLQIGAASRPPSTPLV
ncbi:MAG: Rieske 2Fe-2S domain-containing protein [Acidimicrobiales bacterium]